MRPLYGFEITTLVGFVVAAPRFVWGGASLVYGGYSERETPGSIPNPEVKALCADGTALVTVWESRSPPVFDWDTGRPWTNCPGPFCFKYQNLTPTFYTLSGSRAKRPAPALT